MDTIEKIGKASLIQHGQQNRRIYLMKLSASDCPGIIPEIDALARKNRYTKIFCKVPQALTPHFMARGYLQEAQIPAFYNNRESVFFMSKFLGSDRLLDPETKELNELSALLSNPTGIQNSRSVLPEEYSVRLLGDGDCDEMAKIYSSVFESYPFPIFDPAYIRKTMQENIRYFGIETRGELVALASSEMDVEGKNAEMTDFATLPTQRGKGLASVLLNAMEKQMRAEGIRTLYTIARLHSKGMNKAFLKLDYRYSGTLLKNTNISGKIESMNIYYKHLP